MHRMRYAQLDPGLHHHRNQRGLGVLVRRYYQQPKVTTKPLMYFSIQIWVVPAAYDRNNRGCRLHFLQQHRRRHHCPRPQR